MPAVHTEAMAGRGETRRWMSAAGGASGDRVLASNILKHITVSSIIFPGKRTLLSRF